MNKMSTRILSLVICLACIALALTTQTKESRNALAAGSDPQVVIVKDITNTQPCILTVTVNIGTPHQQMFHPACPAGTHLATFVVPLSFATSHHLAYVFLPPQHATVQQERQVADEITALTAETREAIQKVAHTHGILQQFVPLTGCGSAGSISGGWEPGYNYSINLQGYLHFYRNYSNCSEVDVDKIEIVRQSGPTNYLESINNSSNSTIIYVGGSNGYSCPAIGSNWQTYAPGSGMTWPASYGTHARWVTLQQGWGRGCLYASRSDTFDMGALS